MSACLSFRMHSAGCGRLALSSTVQAWHASVCVCVCVNACMHTRRSETGKIESAKALPYHRFTVPLFPFQRVCLCVSWCKSSLYMRCCRALNPLLHPAEVSLRQILDMYRAQRGTLMPIQIRLYSCGHRS